MKLRHLLWSPYLPTAILVYFVVRVATAGGTWYRAFAIAWMLLWLGLALYNRYTSGGFVRWLYDERTDGDDKSQGA